MAGKVFRSNTGLVRRIKGYARNVNGETCYVIEDSQSGEIRMTPKNFERWINEREAEEIKDETR